MSRTTIMGIIISVGILFFAVTMQTVSVMAFINPSGLAIVMGGTAAAALTSYSINDIVRVFKVFAIVMQKQSIQLGSYVSVMTKIAERVRIRGLLSLQNEVKGLPDPFLRDGLQMLIDGYAPEELRDIMDQRIINHKIRENNDARIFRTMARFAPAFGMLGTVIGLIAMLQKMSGSNMENLGPSMAVALVTTFYGLILANMVFNPIAEKLERRTEERIVLMSMIVDGLVLIGEQWHPAKIHDSLNSFLAPGQRKIPNRQNY